MDKEFFTALPPETALIAGAVLGALGCVLLVFKIIKEFQSINSTARSTAVILAFLVLGFFSFLYAQAAYKNKADILETEKEQLQKNNQELVEEKEILIASLEAADKRSDIEVSSDEKNLLITLQRENTRLMSIIAKLSEQLEETDIVTPNIFDSVNVKKRASPDSE